MQEPLNALAPLSIIVPAFNAAPVLGTTLRAIGEWLSDTSLEHEVIVVDDGSRDDTPSVAAESLREFGARGRLLRHEVNRGKGAAVRTGMLASGGEWALFLDADHSTHVRHAELVAREAAAGADVVIGSRRVAGADIVCTRPRSRQWLGDLFPLMTRAVSGHGASDSQCGFKAVKRWAVGPVFEGLRTERFAFDIEMLVRSRLIGARVREIPVRWDNPSESTLRLARDGPSMMRDALKIAWRLRSSGREARELAKASAARPANQLDPALVVVEVPDRVGAASKR